QRPTQLVSRRVPQLVEVFVAQRGQDARQCLDVLQVFESLAVGPPLRRIIETRGDGLERHLRLVKPGRTHTPKLCTPTDNPTDKPCRPTHFTPSYPQSRIYPQMQPDLLTTNRRRVR